MKPDNRDRVERIRQRLEAALAPSQLEIRDDSHLHVGHPGARDGRGHFHVTLCSEKFSGRRTLERHRLVFEALGDLMHSDIHAMQIRALAPDESDPQKR